MKTHNRSRDPEPVRLPNATLKTVGTLAVVLVAAGALAGTFVTEAERSAASAAPQSFVGTSPAASSMAAEGNVVDHTY